jgi:hypothetical protein
MLALESTAYINFSKNLCNMLHELRVLCYHAHAQVSHLSCVLFSSVCRLSLPKLYRKYEGLVVISHTHKFCCVIVMVNKMRGACGTYGEGTGTCTFFSEEA